MNKPLSLTPIFSACLLAILLAYFFVPQFFAALIGILLITVNFCFWVRIVYASVNKLGVGEILSFMFGKSAIVIAAVSVLIFCKGDFFLDVCKGASIALITELIFLIYSFRPNKI